VAARQSQQEHENCDF